MLLPHDSFLIDVCLVPAEPDIEFEGPSLPRLAGHGARTAHC